MRTLISSLCIFILTLAPLRLDHGEPQIQRAHAEPVTLTVIGIVVGLAGIALDVYGMTQEKDVSEQVAGKVEEVTANQIKLGLSPLKEINPKLKQLAQSQRQLQQRQVAILKGQDVLQRGQDVLQRGQERLAQGQRVMMANQVQLIEGQRTIISNQGLLIKGQDVLKRGQDELRSGQVALSEQLVFLRGELKRHADKGQRLIKTLQRENRRQHKQTQALVVGLQQARYSAAIELIDLAKGAVKTQPEQANQWFNRALTLLLEAQAYFGQQERAGAFVSREYRALIHLSLATCYLGLNMGEKGIEEVAKLVGTPSAGQGLVELIEASQSAGLNTSMSETFREIRAWSNALIDERIRLAKLKKMAVKIIIAHPKLRALWSERDNYAYGRARRAERELALQAFAVAASRYQSELGGATQPQSERRSSRRADPVNRVDVHKDRELRALRMAAQAFKEVKTLAQITAQLAETSSPLNAELVRTRQTYQRVYALFAARSQLSAELLACAERKHPERSVDCTEALALMEHTRHSLERIDEALDIQESAR